MHGLIGHFDVHRIPIRVRINGDRFDPHLLGGLNHAAGDFAAVSNQDFLEHEGGPSNAKPPHAGLTCGGGFNDFSRIFESDLRGR
jgi:hypothetical protein